MQIRLQRRMGMTTANLISIAERSISDILKQLEIDTDSIVDKIMLDDIEITKMGDVRPQLLRSIQIVMMRLPGSHW